MKANRGQGWGQGCGMNISARITQRDRKRGGEGATETEESDKRRGK